MGQDFRLDAELNFGRLQLPSVRRGCLRR